MSEGHGSGWENVRFFPWKLSDEALALLTRQTRADAEILAKALHEAYKAGLDAASSRSSPEGK